MKKLLWVVLMVIALFLITACAKMETVLSLPGISFEAPEKWAEIVQEDSAPAYNIWKCSYAFDNGEEIIAMASGVGADEKANFDSFYNTNVSENMEVSEYFEDFVIGDKNGKRILGKTTENDVSMNTEIVLVQKADYFYSFTHKFPVDVSPKNEKDFGKIIESLQFTSIDENFVKLIESAKAEQEVQKTSDIIGGDNIVMPLDSSTITEKLKQDVAVAKNGDLVIFLTNENDFTVNFLEEKVTFYDENKNIVGVGEDYFYAIEPGKTVVSAIECLSSNYEPAGFADYEIKLNVQMDIPSRSLVDDIAVEHNASDNQVFAKYTNNSNDTIMELSTMVVYYEGENVIGVGRASSVYEFSPNATETVEYYPVTDSNYDAIPYDRYEIFINGAYVNG